jgi:hypothetical protein
VACCPISVRVLNGPETAPFSELFTFTGSDNSRAYDFIVAERLLVVSGPSDHGVGRYAFPVLGLGSRCAALRFPLVLFVAAVAMLLAGCGGQGSGGHASIGRSAALTKLYDAIDAAPSWVTAQDSTAARANINYAPGANARCGPDYGKSGPNFARFVCYLRYLGASAQPQRLWFSENGNGSDIVPLSQAQFQAFAANVVAYERRRLPASKPLDLFKHGATLASLEQADAKVQPRVRGRACDGSDGMEHATPSASIVTPGNYLTAGPGTSCAIAQVVATALGDSPKPRTAVLSVPDRTTGRRLTLRCHSMSRLGPVECAGAGGLVVYLGSYDAPLPSSS